MEGSSSYLCMTQDLRVDGHGLADLRHLPGELSNLPGARLPVQHVHDLTQLAAQHRDRMHRDRQTL